MDYEQRKQAILSLRNQGYTLREIGDSYGISRERVRQIVGNTGHRLNTDRLRKDAEFIRRLVYEYELVERETVAFIYHVSDHTLQLIIGTRHDYLDKQGLRRCYTCKQVKSKKEFGKNATVSDGLSHRCAECNRASARAYYRRSHPQVLRRFARRNPKPA